VVRSMVWAAIRGRVPQGGNREWCSLSDAFESHTSDGGRRRGCWFTVYEGKVGMPLNGAPGWTYIDAMGFIRIVCCGEEFKRRGGGGKRLRGEKP